MFLVIPLHSTRFLSRMTERGRSFFQIEADAEILIQRETSPVFQLLSLAMYVVTEKNVAVFIVRNIYYHYNVLKLA